jgi:hypothetical protein
MRSVAQPTAVLVALAKQHNLIVREVMLSDEHLAAARDIFYDGLPKLARMTMKRGKFQASYLDRHEKLADEMLLVKSA